MLKATALRPVTEITTCQNFQNMRMESAGGNPYPAVIGEMAMKMIHIHKDIEDVLNGINKAYSRGETKFIVSLRGKEKEQKQRILSWLEEMKGAVGNYFYDCQEESVGGFLEDMPRARKFLTGGYMEIAIAKETEKIVSKLANQYRQTFEVKSNVQVTTLDGSQRNEFDVVILFGQMLYVIEVKTGNYFREYTKYYSIGRRYGIIPNRILLVDSQLTEDEADRAEYFSEYYVSTFERFEEKLIHMISTDMEVKNYD